MVKPYVYVLRETVTGGIYPGEIGWTLNCDGQSATQYTLYVRGAVVPPVSGVELYSNYNTTLAGLRFVHPARLAAVMAHCGAWTARVRKSALVHWLWMSACLSGCSAQTLVETQEEYVTCGGSVSGSTIGLANQIGSPAPDAVYLFCACNTGTHVFDSCGSGFDTWLRVLNAPNPASPVADCDDCGPCGTRTILTTELNSGQCYFFVVDGFSSGAGESTPNRTHRRSPLLTWAPTADRAQGRTRSPPHVRRALIAARLLPRRRRNSHHFQLRCSSITDAQMALRGAWKVRPGRRHSAAARQSQTSASTQSAPLQSTGTLTLRSRVLLMEPRSRCFRPSQNARPVAGGCALERS